MMKKPSTRKALPCLLHVGQSKTGTTSIQATLFRELDDPGFVLISLDSFFGNQTLAGAFLPEPEAGKSFFLQRVPAKRLEARKASARNWLDSGLRVARRRGAIPILSAEVVAGLFSEPAMQDLRNFLIERGFSPRVIAYLRPPLDWIESGVQQLTRCGRTNLWSLTMDKLSGCDPWGMVERLDRVFGRENVELHLFNPDLFPDRCVVRHFCEQAGIPLPKKIIRENDSLNLNALRFVHASRKRECSLYSATDAGDKKSGGSSWTSFAPAPGASFQLSWSFVQISADVSREDGRASPRHLDCSKTRRGIKQ
jgi:hypothetical protein